MQLMKQQLLVLPLNLPVQILNAGCVRQEGWSKPFNQLACCWATSSVPGKNWNPEIKTTSAPCQLWMCLLSVLLIILWCDDFMEKQRWREVKYLGSIWLLVQLKITDIQNLFQASIKPECYFQCHRYTVSVQLFSDPPLNNMHTTWKSALCSRFIMKILVI